MTLTTAPPGQLKPVRRVPFWRRPWMLPLALALIAFLGYLLPPYLTLDPSQARIPGLRKDIPWHYPALWGHIMFGTIAIVGISLQVWPWLRMRWPKLHRVLGRFVIWFGIAPSAVLALVIVPFSFGPPGNAVAALIWLWVTYMGLRRARQRRYVEHRRYMIYSFALVLQIVWGRIMFFTIPHLPSFTDAIVPLMLETATWIGFVINLVIAQIWLHLRPGMGARRPA